MGGTAQKKEREKHGDCECDADIVCVYTVLVDLLRSSSWRDLGGGLPRCRSLIELLAARAFLSTLDGPLPNRESSAREEINKLVLIRRRSRRTRLIRRRSPSPDTEQRLVRTADKETGGRNC